MFVRINKITKLESYIANVFSLYRKNILSLHLKQWKEEDISGKSCVQYKIYQYYLAVYYVILIYLELKQGINTNWDYYKTKYKIDNISKCLACDNIDLDAILKIFGLPSTICVEGIECVGLEENFEIEPEFLDDVIIYEKVVIKDLLKTISSCQILLPSKCSVETNLDFILQLSDEQEFLIL